METGTVHILSVSGCTSAFWRLFCFCFWAGNVAAAAGIVLVAATIVAYAILTYAEPPIVRAAILVVLICLGRLLGRKRAVVQLACGRRIVVLIMNPADLFRTGRSFPFGDGDVRGVRTAIDVFITGGPARPMIAQSRPWGFAALTGFRRG